MVYARSRDWHITKLIEAGKIEQAQMYREIYKQERDEYHKLVADKYILAILTGRYDHVLDLLLNDHNEAVRKAAETRFSEARSDVEQAIAERIAGEKKSEAFYEELTSRPPEGSKHPNKKTITVVLIRDWERDIPVQARLDGDRGAVNCSYPG